MNKMTWVSLLFGSTFLSIFVCNGMNTTLSEVRIVQPSLSPLCENFRAENGAFKQQAESAVEELKRVSGDDAVLLSSKLQKDLRTVAILKVLIEDCKSSSGPTIKSDKKSTTLQICRYLIGVMPYAGKMQDVISAVLKKEFSISSISELEAIAR